MMIRIGFQQQDLQWVTPLLVFEFLHLCICICAKQGLCICSNLRAANNRAACGVTSLLAHCFEQAAIGARLNIICNICDICFCPKCPYL